MGEAVMKLTQRCAKNIEKGQSLIELAISMIILLILLAGIVDLGRALFTRFTLMDAAEEGIIYGIGFPTDCNQIVERIQANLSSRVLPESVSISVNIERNDGTFSTCYIIPFAEVYAGKILRVNVSSDFAIGMPFLGSFVGGQSIPLEVEANGIILRPPPPD